MYLTRSDAPVLAELLSQDPEIAFLLRDSPMRWRAVKESDIENHERVGLWHVPSGSLPLLPRELGKPSQEILDPWSGWMEKRVGADSRTPNFGAGHVGIIWLNLRFDGSEKDSCCGLSSFEWIGNHYRIIGNAALPATEAWWKSLRRKISKLTIKIPRKSLQSTSRKEIFAFSCAYSLLKTGSADLNP